MTTDLPPVIAACMIDLDGTLVDTLGDFEAALNLMLADVRLPPVSRTFIERTVGQGSEHLIRSVLAAQLPCGPQAAAAVDALYERAWQAYQTHYRSINGRHAEVYPGVLEGLQTLRAAGLPLVCLTNKPRAFAQGLLVAKGLDGFFTHIFGGDSFTRKKPDPLPLVEACRVLGQPPAHVLMVGDSRNDAQAARAAGCPVLLLTYGYNHGEPVQALDADGYLATLADAPAWLAARAGKPHP